jgi:uncharacterized protein with NRDE domain
MCLIVLGYRQHPVWRLIVAANRDEFYARATAALAYWEDAPEILAGRDLLGGGTWLGITRSGKVAAVTNFRDASAPCEKAPSRGLLVANYLRGDEAPRSYVETLRASANQYNGFSLLVGDREALYYYCNRENLARELRPGVYGLSNHLLDTPWPKIVRAKRALRRLIDMREVEPKRILNVLSDTTCPADDQLPSTGVGLGRERLLSPIFIASETYGTRSSTALLIGHDGRVTVTERDSLAGQRKSYEMQLD